MTQERWVRTRELITDWSASWSRSDSHASRSLLAIKWRGLSVWWMTNLVTKDTSVDFDWFLAVHRRINAESVSTKIRSGNAPSTFRLVCLFLADVLRLILIRWTLPRVNNPSPSVWFHSFAYNLKSRNRSYVVDRNFEMAPNFGEKYGFSTGYLISFMSPLPGLAEVTSWISNVRSSISNLQHIALALDSYLSVVDLLQCHFAAAKCLLKLRVWQRSQKLTSFGVIDGIDCSDILLKELEASFFGPVQQAMLSAVAFSKFRRRHRGPLTIVTYGELFGPMRAIYHQVRQENKNTLFVSVQHAMLCENKLGAYHRKSEFAHCGQVEGGQYSPSPDWYLVNGSQYEKILRAFYPSNKIAVIGSLKYDTWINFSLQQIEIQTKIRARLNLGDRRLMIVAPSVNDSKCIFEILSNARLGEQWVLAALPHPTISMSQLAEVLDKNKLKDRVHIPIDVPMPELLIAADLVVCGISTVAIEAAIFSKQAVRLVSSDVFPQFPMDSNIPIFSDSARFSDWLNRDYDSLALLRVREDYQTLVEKYFFAVDGNSAIRLWDFISRKTLCS